MSPLGGWGSSLALGFVLVVAAIKAIWEDAKRHQEDGRTNASVAHRYMPDGTAPPEASLPFNIQLHPPRMSIKTAMAMSSSHWIICVCYGAQYAHWLTVETHADGYRPCRLNP